MNKSSSYKTDLILTKGNIITLDPLIPKATWLSIKNGIIIDIGKGEAWKDYYDSKSRVIVTEFNSSSPTIRFTSPI